jgi:hypothetical protein
VVPIAAEQADGKHMSNCQMKAEFQIIAQFHAHFEPSRAKMLGFPMMEEDCLIHA